MTAGLALDRLVSGHFTKLCKKLQKIPEMTRAFYNDTIKVTMVYWY